MAYIAYRECAATDRNNITISTLISEFVCSLLAKDYGIVFLLEINLRCECERLRGSVIFDEVGEVVVPNDVL